MRLSTIQRVIDTALNQSCNADVANGSLGHGVIDMDGKVELGANSPVGRNNRRKRGRDGARDIDSHRDANNDSFLNLNPSGHRRGYADAIPGNVRGNNYRTSRGAS